MIKNTRLAAFWIVVGILAAAALFFAPLLNNYHSFGESTILMWETFGIISGFILAVGLLAIFFMWFWDWAHKA